MASGPKSITRCRCICKFVLRISDIKRATSRRASAWRRNRSRCRCIRSWPRTTSSTSAGRSEPSTRNRPMQPRLSTGARCFVTGAAGFIGSNLVDRLLAMGHEVVGFDNFSTGNPNFLEPALQNPCFRLIRGDLLDLEQLTEAVSGCEMVFHLAANADVRFGTDHPRRDLDQNTIATWNVLEAMRRQNIRRIAFSSTGSVYGEAKVIPTPEECPFPV